MRDGLRREREKEERGHINVAQWLMIAYFQPRFLLWTPNPYIQCLLNISPWKFQRHYRPDVSKLNSHALSPNLVFLCSWYLSMVCPIHSLGYASWKSRSYFDTSISLIAHIQSSTKFWWVCLLNIIQICPFLFYSHHFSPCREQKSSGFDSCWSTHLPFCLRQSIFHRAAKEIIQNARFSDGSQIVPMLWGCTCPCRLKSALIWSIFPFILSSQLPRLLSSSLCMSPPPQGLCPSTWESWPYLLGVYSDSCFRSWLSLPQHLPQKYLLNDIGAWRGILIS